MRSTLPTFDEVWQQHFRQSVLNQLQQFPKSSRLFVACSGGLDSLLLLSVLVPLCANHLNVVYIDHQLQVDSAKWGRHVTVYAEKLNIPVHIIAVQVAQGNVEQQARLARQQAFRQLLAPQDVLILAHHQQDQAETVLLRLLSGTGVQGLSAMKYCQYHQQNQYFIWRPFLHLSRQQLQQWAEQINLDFVHDPMNDDIYYDRVWCRKVLWQILEQRFPQMQNAMARTSQIMQDADEILHEVAMQDLHVCGDKNYLNINSLLTLSEARKRQLLSLWIKGDSQYRPNFEMVQRLCHEMIFSREDAQAELKIDQYYYVRYDGKIYRYHQRQWQQFQTIMHHDTLYFNQYENNIMSLDNNMQLSIQTQTVGLAWDLLDKPLQLVARQGGEKIQLQGDIYHRPLKKILQMWKIPTWQRKQVYLLKYQNEILGIVGLALPYGGFVLAKSDYVIECGWQPILQVIEQEFE